MTKHTHQRQSKAQWANHIDNQVASGLEILDYCQSHGISKSSFYKWKRIFESELAQTNNQFIEFPRPSEPKEAPDCSASRRIELDLGNGMTLRVYS